MYISPMKLSSMKFKRQHARNIHGTPWNSQAVISPKAIVVRYDVRIPGTCSTRRVPLEVPFFSIRRMSYSRLLILYDVYTICFQYTVLKSEGVHHICCMQCICMSVCTYCAYILYLWYSSKDWPGLVRFSSCGIPTSPWTVCFFWAAAGCEARHDRRLEKAPIKMPEVVRGSEPGAMLIQQLFQLSFHNRKDGEAGG